MKLHSKSSEQKPQAHQSRSILPWHQPASDAVDLAEREELPINYNFGFLENYLLHFFFLFFRCLFPIQLPIEEAASRPIERRDARDFAGDRCSVYETKQDLCDYTYRQSAALGKNAAHPNCAQCVLLRIVQDPTNNVDSVRVYHRDTLANCLKTDLTDFVSQIEMPF